ncbi:MAG: ATP-binding cassette domain-containing protein [Bacteroidetes bacterium]|nr:ATP-binding cassette domain-containing protein [Bacteroidota bacterium]
MPLSNTIQQEKNRVIALSNVYKAFDENEVLRGANLDVLPGENVVVLGRSGTGKSVLIKIISGMLLADSGHVEVLGQDVSRLSQRELQALRLRIGFSFQSSALYDSMTVQENLLFPLVRNKRHLSRKEKNTAVETVLDAVGLLQTLKQYPSELSGGQRKRVGIARTLILQPELMLYDEPTAGLDPITSTEINALIREVQSRFKTTSIIITHDLACAKSTGDRVAILLDGLFHKEGTFAEVFADKDPRIQSFYDYNFTQ